MFHKIVWQHMLDIVGFVITILTADLVANRPVKEFRKSSKIWQRYHHEYSILLVMEHAVLYWFKNNEQVSKVNWQKANRQHTFAFVIAPTFSPIRAYDLTRNRRKIAPFHTRTDPNRIRTMFLWQTQHSVSPNGI